MLNFLKKNTISDKNISIYYLINFCRSLVFSIPIWIVFYRRIISIEQISFLVGFQYFVNIISELPTGAFADILGKRVSIIVGFFLFSAGSFLFPFATTFLHYVVVAGLIGLADSFLSGSTEALLYDSMKQDKREREFSEVVANQGVIFQVGLVTGTILGGIIYQWNIFIPFLLEGFFLLLGGIFSFFLIEPDIDTEIFTLKNYVKQMKQGAKEAFKNSFLKKLSWFYIAVGSITWAATIYFNSSMMVDLGFSDSERGFISGSIRLLNIILLSKLLKNKKIFSERNSILFFPIIMIISFLPGILLEGWFALPFIAGAMVSSTARWIILGRMTNDHFSSKYRATAISTLSMLVGVFFILLTFISGPVIAFGTTRLMYTILGVLTIFTVVPLGKSLLNKIP
ncbi:MAG: MFS transporter [Candidatus Pacebacteria bacterium]|jgi:MFS family permease|nr:MFS transporter [Candidatus Paceibacterota bacterium]MBT4652572.1 MFS transporter [Candidatus Paceibacterota bacterium]MBT6756399.1 MFS transporter [Candidatus Paceibacterota bacterium]MBT6921307.1 MFS transporter [Candidatus Paceibacterota bacterium]